MRRRRDLAGSVPRRRLPDRTPPVPRTRHHLPQPGTAIALTGTARRLGITTKTKHIRDTDRVTVRDPDAITALLTQIGAPDTAGTWAQQRTQRQERTPGPRRPGFDDANHTRATHAAAAAATRVQCALVILGDQVPDNLAVVAAMRMTHSEVSLEALGRMMDPPMTKDAVAGRIRRQPPPRAHRATRPVTGLRGTGRHVPTMRCLTPRRQPSS